MLRTFECVVLLLFLGPAVFAAGYHLFLGIIGLFLSRKPSRSIFPLPKMRFAILVPAHDEELLIEQTVKRLQHEIDYPAERVHIFVIADNCSDATAEIARRTGVRVLERHNAENRGKGFALSDAFPVVFAECDCDGVLVVDADCRIDRHALRSLDSRLQKSGNIPLQLNYIVDNPDTSSISYLLGVANNLENDFFYASKDLLQWFVVLRGTGMYLPRPVLERFPWQAFSVVEDTDYTLQLLHENVQVGFIRDACVLSEFPAERKTLAVQRKRWIGGTFAFIFSKSFPLVFRGIVRMRPRTVDAGLTLLLLSRPLLILQLMLTTFLTFLMIWPMKSALGWPFFLASLACWPAYLIYFSFGVFRIGLTGKRFMLLIRLPFETLAYLLFALRALFGGSVTAWERTPREKK